MNEDQFIHFGQAKHGEEFQRLDPKTKQVASIISFLSKTLFGETLETTSIYRKQTVDSGIHSLYRAVDLKPLKKIENTYRLIQMVNGLFVYDSRTIDAPESFKPDELEKRKKLQVADQNVYHGTAAHIHIQTHPTTTFLTKHLTVDLLTMAGKDSANFKPLDLKA